MINSIEITSLKDTKSVREACKRLGVRYNDLIIQYVAAIARKQGYKTRVVGNTVHCKITK